MNIVVLAGGLSTERDVSFKTGAVPPLDGRIWNPKHFVRMDITLFYWMFLWDTVTKRKI